MFKYSVHENIYKTGPNERFGVSNGSPRSNYQARPAFNEASPAFNQS